jgi:hypothetical protein
MPGKHQTYALGLLALFGIAATVHGQDARQSPSSPAFVQRGLPGAAHRALEPLVGTWKVEKTSYIAGGAPQKPVSSRDIISRREWLADGRFLRDETQGQIGGSKYWRLGLLGYSTMDRCYEWVTIDALNANMMIYRGVPGSGERLPITVTGVFTDQGLISERTAGKPIQQRTVIRIESNDRHVIELYLRPPNAAEFLADRAVYTRVP